MQPFIELRRASARLVAAVAALIVIALPRLALAAPPAQEAPEAAEEAAGFFTQQWWIEHVGGLVSADILQMGWKLALALLMLFVGWLFAKLLAAGVFRVLRKTDFDNKLAERLGFNLLIEDRERKPGDEDVLERGIAKVVYWLAMALVVVAVLDFAELEQTAAPIQRLVDTVIQTLPFIAKAILILVVAYAAASILRKLVTKTLTATGVDRRIAQLDVEVDATAEVKEVKEVKEGEEAAAAMTFSETIGQVVFWLVMILGLAGAFDALQINAISEPLTNVINTLLGLLPVVGIAAVILFGGYLLAKVVRVIVTRALESLGFDKLLTKIKLDGMFGNSTPSKVVGWLVQALILIQAVIAALDQVGLATLSQPMTDMMRQFWDLLPVLAISALFVVLGVFAGRLLRGIVQKALVGVGFDRLMGQIGFGQIAERDDDLAKPSGLVAFVVQVVIVMLAIAQALQNLQLHTWANYVDAFLRFAVTRAAVALVIVGVGFVIGNYVRDLIAARQRGERPPAPEGVEPAAPEPVWMAEFARYAVLVFAFTMAIHQLGVAETFVLLSFALLFGALCLAGALAFGLGSRDLAGEIVRDRYRKAKQSSPPPTSSPFGSIKPPTKPGQ
ncbi:MAG: mechanosensitive ion channel [Enhygromyxa sp.]